MRKDRDKEVLEIVAKYEPLSKNEIEQLLVHSTTHTIEDTLSTLIRRGWIDETKQDGEINYIVDISPFHSPDASQSELPTGVDVDGRREAIRESLPDHIDIDPELDISLSAEQARSFREFWARVNQDISGFETEDEFLDWLMEQARILNHY